MKGGEIGLPKCVHFHVARCNASYHIERLRVSREYQRLFPEMDTNTRVHICRAEGEALWELGRQSEAEAVYQQLVAIHCVFHGFLPPNPREGWLLAALAWNMQSTLIRRGAISDGRINTPYFGTGCMTTRVPKPCLRLPSVVRTWMTARVCWSGSSTCITSGTARRTSHRWNRSCPLDSQVFLG